MVRQRKDRQVGRVCSPHWLAYTLLGEDRTPDASGEAVERVRGDSGRRGVAPRWVLPTARARPDGCPYSGIFSRAGFSILGLLLLRPAETQHRLCGRGNSRTRFFSTEIFSVGSFRHENFSAMEIFCG